MTEPVVTRFAPSPTGFLHIGGARTALFNWLYARGRGGKMLLRIEDTDRERSTKAAIDAILDGLTWLGIDWDGETVYQFARAARHREVAEQLLAAGRAYRCYASPEELDRDAREGARREGRSKLYDGRWRDRDPSEAPPGVKPVIRLKAPLTGETVIDDQVQGRVTWQNENLDDLVLLRSDGTPTYMLAVVVDDHDMGVTHIIRGDDHLTNAARQKQIYDALGWTVPVMAHIPLIHGPDGAKALQAPRRARRRCLSRHGLPAGGDAQLSGAPRLEPRRPGNLLDRGDDRRLRPAADRPLAGALRLRQARKPQRPLHPPERRRRSPRRDRARAAASRRAAPSLPPSSRRSCAPSCIAAMPGLKERAKTLVELIDGARFICWPTARSRSTTRPRALLTPRRASLIGRARAGARRGRALDHPGDRSTPCAPSPNARASSSARRAAAARRADRAHHLARRSSTCWPCWESPKAWRACAIRP